MHSNSEIFRFGLLALDRFPPKEIHEKRASKLAHGTLHARQVPKDKIPQFFRYPPIRHQRNNTTTNEVTPVVSSIYMCGVCEIQEHNDHNDATTE